MFWLEKHWAHETLKFSTLLVIPVFLAYAQQGEECNVLLKLYSAGIVQNSFTEGCNLFRKSTLTDHIHMADHKTAMKVPELKKSLQDSHNGKARKRDGCYSGRGIEQAAIFMPLLRNRPPKKNRHLFQKEWSKKRQLSKHWSMVQTSTCHLLFTTLNFVFCKRGILLFLNPQDTMSY